MQLRGGQLPRLILLSTSILLLHLPSTGIGRNSPGGSQSHGGRALPLSEGDLSAGNVVYTVTDVGAHGWFDPQAAQAHGSGFRFGGLASALFHAGLILATDPSHVADACYGSDDNGASIPFNFVSTCPVQLGSTPDIFQTAFARFDDSDPDSAPLALRIRQHAYAWPGSPNNDYVVLEYDITNEGPDLVLYAGWYADWDIGSATSNNVGYDVGRSLGYMTDTGGPDPSFYGISVLSHAPAGFRAVFNPTWVYPDGEAPGDPGFEDADKFDFLTGFDVVSSDVPADWSVQLGVGPLSLSSGASVKVTFLMVAGASLADLQANLDAARTQYPSCRPAVLCP